jgi:hypothetical protein
MITSKVYIQLYSNVVKDPVTAVVSQSIHQVTKDPQGDTVTAHSG